MGHLRTLNTAIKTSAVNPLADAIDLPGSLELLTSFTLHARHAVMIERVSNARFEKTGISKHMSGEFRTCCAMRVSPLRSGKWRTGSQNKLAEQEQFEPAYGGIDALETAPAHSTLVSDIRSEERGGQTRRPRYAGSLFTRAFPNGFPNGSPASAYQMLTFPDCWQATGPLK
jgi:hypothetical protein